MDNRTSSDDSEIWLKYCEECVKSKIELEAESSAEAIETVIKKDPS